MINDVLKRDTAIGCPSYTKGTLAQVCDHIDEVQNPIRRMSYVTAHELANDLGFAEKSIAALLGRANRHRRRRPGRASA
jgi:hypothetical protein